MSRHILLCLALTIAMSPFAVRCSGADTDAWNAPVTQPDGAIILKVVMVEDEDEDPMAAGKTAAEALKQAMAGESLKAVIVSECFEDKEYKEQALAGVCSVLGKDIVFGGATYGSFTQAGCTDFDSICLLGIGGDGIGVSAGLVTDMGTSKLAFDEHQAEIERRLHAAGKKLGNTLHRTDRDKLLILIPDAHSPKNQYLVEGAQAVFGKRFPMTGGSANKNAGQTFIYFRGQTYEDSALSLMLSGDFQVAMTGRQARDNAAVIRSAREGAAEAAAKTKTQPIAALAYNCAGRRGKLQNMEDELTAIQQSIGKEIPLFGCYNAGEIGPLDVTEKDSDAFCGGSGWHVMFTIISRE